MNNHEKFTKLFLEFEEETKKKVDKNLTLEECTNKLKEKGYNPYVREDSFIDFCRRLRNMNFHNVNDDYYLITDNTIEKLERIVEEVKHPFKVENKATKNVFSACLDDNVLDVMKEMNENNYTHIPIYLDSSKKELVGIFSENSIFQYLLKDKIIEVDEDKKFSDIKECIAFDNSKEIVKFVKRDKLYDDVVNDFVKEFKAGKKLSCVMVTHSGSKTEKVIGILTSWDIIGR